MKAVGCYHEYMKRVIWVAVVGIVLLIIVGISSVVLLGGKSSAPDQTTGAPISSEVLLSIPGAEPIPAIAEDYRSPDSLWVVVSKSRPLPEQDYSPENVVVPSGIAVNTQKSTEEQSVRSDIVEPLTQMLTAAKAAGHDLFLASGYRSYDLQETYYTNYVRTSGQAEADQFSAKPGYSEHQTGLSFDLSLANRQCYLEICFGESPAGKWVADNAHTYGFIVRYPADKTDITGYQYEPWHLRYVGTDLAGVLHESGKTLDEIVPQLEAARTQLIEQKLITE
jgi:D-alanyl-D-alanine carboxypeptidase